MDFTSQSAKNHANFKVVLGETVTLNPKYKWKVCLKKFACSNTFDTLHNRYGRAEIGMMVRGYNMNNFNHRLFYGSVTKRFMPEFCSLKTEDEFIAQLYACMKGIRLRVANKPTRFVLIDLEQLLEIRFNKADNSYYTRIKQDNFMPYLVKLKFTGMDAFDRPLEIYNILGKKTAGQDIILETKLTEQVPMWMCMSDKGGSLLKSFSSLDLRCNLAGSSPYISNRNGSLGIYPMASWLKESSFTQLGVIQKQIRQSPCIPVSLMEFSTVKFHLVQQQNGEMYTILKNAFPTNITLAFKRVRLSS